jgi:hypothetical protein
MYTCIHFIMYFFKFKQTLMNAEAFCVEIQVFVD